MAKLAPGAVVSARQDLAFTGGVIPTGRRGVVERVEAAGPGPVVHTRFPVVVSGQRRLVTIAASPAAAALECRSAAVLRDPAHRATPSKQNARCWSSSRCRWKGRAHRELTRCIRDAEIDSSHFRGRGWSRGETASSHASVARVRDSNAWTDEQVLVARSPALASRGIVRRLLALGWSYQCAWCGATDWRGQRLTLHLDHINGTSTDNRLVNLAAPLSELSFADGNLREPSSLARSCVL